MGSEINPNVIISDYKVPGLNDAPEIKLRVYTPKNTLKTNPGIYYIHGGGMIIGSIIIGTISKKVKLRETVFRGMIFQTGMFVWIAWKICGAFLKACRGGGPVSR